MLRVLQHALGRRLNELESGRKQLLPPFCRLKRRKSVEEWIQSMSFAAENLRADIKARAHLHGILQLDARKLPDVGRRLASCVSAGKD